MTSHELEVLNESHGNTIENELDGISHEVKDYDVTSCGIGRCHPKSLEFLANINTFTFVFSMSLLPLTVLEVYIGSQISSIEKQFGLNSTTVGILIGCFEIGFLVTVLPFGHFGQRSHIPRILSFTAVLGGISGILLGACNYIQPAYLPVFDHNSSAASSFPDAPLCFTQNESQRANTSDDTCTNMTSQSGSSHQWVAGVLGVFLALLGVARSPSISLSMAFIDDNVSHPSKTSIYLGIIFTLAVIGPAVALSVGGAVAQIPVDFKETMLKPEHHKWIGAWWLGFFIFGSLSVSTACPMFFFPRKLKGRRVKQQQPQQQPYSFHRVIKQLVRSLKNVLCMPVFVLLLTASCSFMFFIEGDAIFASKYVEHQFMIPSYKASLILGLEQLVAATVGNICGGLITYKLKLSRLGCLKLVLISTFVSSLLYCLEFFFGCENPDIVGMPHHGIINTSCVCDFSSYYPICGSDVTSYFSPCSAGCEQQIGTNFTECSGIRDGLAVAGLCRTGCPYLYYYIAVDLICVLVGTMCLTPLGIAFMRTVNDSDKSLALALNSFLNSLLGFLPAPILYGMVVDSSCRVWNTSCGEVNECAHYDIHKLRIRIKCLSTIGQAVGISLVFAAFLVLRKIDASAPDVQKQSTDKATELQEEIEEKPMLKA